MKKYLLFILFSIMNGWVVAQTQLTGTSSQEVMQQLMNSAASIQTMQCRFVQSKTMAMLAEPSIAEGTMHYVSPDKMRWEYITPYASALIVNGERIIKVTDGKEEVLDAKSSRMYQGMVNIIMDCASGRKLFDATVFDVILYDDGALWKAEMTPKRRDMKRMFAQLVFRFDKTTSIISQVEMMEASGDVTSIQFEDIRIEIENLEKK